jgi:hypothetical protein
MDSATRDRYLAWIAENVEGSGYGECEQIAGAMARAFPEELEVRKGFFFDAVWGRRGHWWCRTRDGRIVDPTARQHPTGALLPEDGSDYEDLTDATPEQMAERVPTGRCMECGDDVYRGQTFCSLNCERAFVLSL